MKLFDDPLSGR